MKFNKFVFIAFLACTTILISFKYSNSYSGLPSNFPEMNMPQDNAITQDRIKLGKLLFFDKRLSKDKSISCESCHKPKFAFADNNAISPGVDGRLGNRNAPTLTNVGYNPFYLFDGFLETLEKQAIVPIEEHAEMDFNIVAISERLAKDKRVQKLARKAYGREIDPFVITRALASFQRTLVSYQSKYDQYLIGKSTFNESEKKGMDLFMNKLNCTKCHSGFNFTNFTNQNNGLSKVYLDSGRMRVTKKEVDRDLFKVPTLRNIALTAPYMHDGSIKSLEEVIRHYETGGHDNKNKSPHLKSFMISDEDRLNIISFLNTLTDPKFIRRHSN